MKILEKDLGGFKQMKIKEGLKNVLLYLGSTG